MCQAKADAMMQKRGEAMLLADAMCVPVYVYEDENGAIRNTTCRKWTCHPRRKLLETVEPDVSR